MNVPPSMTVTTYDTHNPPAADPESGPGKRLREARLAAHLEVEDVAARLHLDAATVRHLEEDNFAALPAPTFVRGYLGSYSRLLDLPPGPIIEAFERQGFAPPPLVPDIANKPQAKSSDLAVRMVTYLIIIGLAVLVLIWWQNQDLGETADAPQAEAPSSQDVAEQSTQAKQGGGSAGTPAPRLTAATDTGDGSGQAQSAVSAPASDPGVGLASRETPEAALPAASTQHAASDEATAPRDTDEGAAVAPGPGAATTADQGKDRLRMQFPSDSWVEVYDSSGERLFFNLAREGSTVDVQGTGPMRVILGYAPGVQVEYNGTPFDPAAYTNREIARFTLGRSPAPPASPAGGAGGIETADPAQSGP